MKMLSTRKYSFNRSLRVVREMAYPMKTMLTTRQQPMIVQKLVKSRTIPVPEVLKEVVLSDPLRLGGQKTSRQMFMHGIEAVTMTMSSHIMKPPSCLERDLFYMALWMYQVVHCIWTVSYKRTIWFWDQYFFSEVIMDYENKRL